MRLSVPYFFYMHSFRRPLLHNSCIHFLDILFSFFSSPLCRSDRSDFRRRPFKAVSITGWTVERHHSQRHPDSILLTNTVKGTYGLKYRLYRVSCITLSSSGVGTQVMHINCGSSARTPSTTGSTYWLCRSNSRLMSIQTQTPRTSCPLNE